MTHVAALAYPPTRGHEGRSFDDGGIDMSHECERLGGCAFYNETLADMPQMADRLKRKYCLDDSAACARKIAAKAIGAENVPVDLFPNDHAKLDRVLADAQ